MTNGIPTPETPKIRPETFPSEQEESDIEADREAYEQSAEHLDDVLHAEEADATTEAPSVSDVVPPARSRPPIALQKDPVVIEVEKILEDGIGSFYATMPEDAKTAFRQKGEAVALEISDMVRTFHVRFRRLISLIAGWLKTIPGVNRYFLAQEAKIKADRILELVEARKNDVTHSV